MPVPQPVRLFHITSIENLEAIVRAGRLVAKNALARRGASYKDIAYQGAQGKRGRIALPNPPGGMIHDCVPFYFAPRSPMLNAINEGRVPDCPNRQTDILHLETTVDAVVATGQPFVFFDRNATLDYSEPYTDLARLDQVAWALMTEAPVLDGFCKYFGNKPGGRYADRMERRMAEFLVRDAVPLGCFTRIGAINAAIRDRAAAILARAGVALPVEAKTDWYFLGQ